MGFLDGLLGASKRETLLSGVTVRHFRTAYKDRLLAHFDAAFPGRETLLWDDADTGIELAVMKPTEAEPFYVAYNHRHERRAHEPGRYAQKPPVRVAALGGAGDVSARGLAGGRKPLA